MKERQNCGSVSEWLDDQLWPDEQLDLIRSNGACEKATTGPCYTVFQ